MIPVTQWREVQDTWSECICASCGDTMFDRNPDRNAPTESHPKHAHPESDGLVGFPRCLHLACFIKEWDARHLTSPA